MKLRPYQQQIISKIKWAMDLEGNDIICVAQGGGKSIIIAEIADHIGEVLVICPGKEILEQNIEKMSKYVPREDIGVFSASMNEKTIKPITFGTIQSMYKVPHLFTGFDVVIYDECDLHNPKNLEGMSNKLFQGAGIKKVLGFTGTPFRQTTYYKRWGRLKWQVETITTTKMINRMKPFFWQRMLVVINTIDLQEQGYLSPIKYYDNTIFAHEEIPTNKSKSDFDLEKFDEMLVSNYGTIATKIMSLPHKSKLIFCASITQAENLAKLIEGSVVVTSKTTKKKREEAVRGLRSGKIRHLLNVGIFTVGFDYPELDCLVLLRPTRSLRLHSQILGRVSRTAPGKDEGHVYDFVSNVKNLGKLEEIKIEKIGAPKPMWNVTSPAYPNGFHYEPLYKFRLRKPKKKESTRLL